MLQTLIIFRSIAGFGIGGANIPFDLLAEFMPISQRGQFGVYIELFWTFGSMIVAGLAWGTLDRDGWHNLAYYTAIPVATPNTTREGFQVPTMNPATITDAETSPKNNPAIEVG